MFTSVDRRRGRAGRKGVSSFGSRHTATLRHQGAKQEIARLRTFFGTALGGIAPCIAVIVPLALVMQPALWAQEAQPPAASPAQAQAAAQPALQPAAAQAPPASTPDVANDRDRRLQEIEQALRKLLGEVEALRSPPRPGTAPGTPAASATQPPVETSPIILPEDWIKTVPWRSIGPANMGGRITDLAVYEADPSTFWVATASGGLLKTTNNGVTFEHQFDREATVSIGAVAVAQTDPNLVWVGTGENNPRNSVSYGDGVYKSTDGGKTWKNMGLTKSFQIGRIVIHPKDPNIVYVGALGRLYGPNEERGVFKTTDGGQTWHKVLYLDDKTGIIDLKMNPADPEVLIAASWEVQRDGFDSWPGSEVPIPDGYNGYDPIKKWGPGSGLHKTTNGGKTWEKLTQGLPVCPLGRIGLDWYRKDPNVVFAVIDCAETGKGPAPLPVFLGAVGTDVGGKATVTQILPGSPAERAGLKPGDVITALGDKAITEFDQILDELRTQRPGQRIRISATRGDEKHDLEVALTSRPGAGGIAAAGGVWLGAAGETRDGKAVLTFVLPAGPAANAGLQQGDVIVSIDGKALDDYSQVTEQIRGKQAGDKLKLVISRGNESKEVTITLQDRPTGFGGGAGRFGGQSASDVYLGIQGENAPGGARLTAITDDGPAEKAGLETGDILKAIDGKEIASYEALVDDIRARRAGDSIKLTVLRGDQTLEMVATLETRAGATRTRPYGYSYGGQSPNVQDQQGAKGFLYGGVYKSTDAGQTWVRINSLNPRPMYFSVIRVDPNDQNYIYLLGVSQHRSTNGGLTFDGDFGRSVHADGHALWIDPRDGRHIIIGTDGGTYVTYDRGANWDHLNHMAIGQFYHVAISRSEPYRVVGGLQDNGSWLGPTLSKNGSGPINEDWISVGGGDGFMCRVDPEDPDFIYYTSQDGNMGRRNLRTGQSSPIRPERARNAPRYRFNWNTPFILSNHNPRIFYCAGNYVFRSLNRGDNLQPISPEITLTKRGSATALAESPRDPNLLYVGTDDGGLWVTRDGGHQWTEVSKFVGLPGPRWVSTIEASRHADGRVYVAFDGHRSDDDEPYVYVSEDYGQSWKSIRANLPWGSTRCLREDLQNENLLLVGTEFAAYCSLDRGKHWNKMNSNLPTVAIHEFAFHPNNGEVVAATHGRSIWICDISPLRQIKPENLSEKIALLQPSPAVRWLREPSRGRTNRRFTGNNPPGGAQFYYTLPKDAQRVSLRIIDVEGNTVREIRGPNQAGFHRVAWDLSRQAPQQGRTGQGGPGGFGRFGRGPGGGPGGAPAGEARPTPPPDPVTTSAPPPATAPAGTPQPPTAQAGAAQPGAAPGTQPPGATQGQGPQRESPGGSGSPRGRGGFGGRGGGGGGPSVPPGTYRVVLIVDGQEFTQTVRVERDPNAPAGLAIQDEILAWEVDASEDEEEEQEDEWIDD
jgi:S1-C subfamily serine protease/photosystem II stability/assembly factor-like uncharacterized protein